jgi:hypothetical protein
MFLMGFNPTTSHIINQCFTNLNYNVVLIIITVFIHAISYSTMQITKWCGYSAKFTSGLLVGQQKQVCGITFSLI